MTNRRLAPGIPRRGPDDNGPAMHHHKRSTAPDDDGSAAAEFAIVVPVLLLLLFVMVTLASVFFDQLHLQAAARDAARAGALDITDACTVAQAALDGNEVGALTCVAITTCSAGSVKMSLTAAKSYSVPLLGNRNVELSASSTFVCPQ